LVLTLFNPAIDVLDPLLKCPVASRPSIKEVVIVGAVAGIIFGGYGHLLGKIKLFSENSPLIFRALAITKV
jgi:hypothetical protein